MTNYETAARQVQQLARVEAFHRGIGLRYEHVAVSCHGLRPRFICEQMELAGFPVWTSAPDEAWNP